MSNQSAARRQRGPARQAGPGDSASAVREAAFDALGHPMRRRLLETLREGPKPVGEIAGVLPIGRPAVSKHLRVLEGAGLVEHRSRGTRNLYAVAPAALAPLQLWLTGLWDDALTAFADYVERHDDGHDDGHDPREPL